MISIKLVQDDGTAGGIDFITLPGTNLKWKTTALDSPFDYQTTYMLRFKGDDAFMDIKETPENETAKDLFLISFKETAKAYQEWESENGNYNWNKEKDVFVGHLLQALTCLFKI